MKHAIIHNKTLFYSLLTALLLSFWLLRGVLSPLVNDVNKSGIIGFELAHHLEQSQTIMSSWDKSATKNATLSLYYDFAFLMAYSSFIALVIARIYSLFSPSSFVYKLGAILCVSAFLAGLMDIVENIALLRLLDGDLQQIWSSTAYYSAVVKFSLLGLCLLYVVLGGSQNLIKTYYGSLTH